MKQPTTSERKKTRAIFFDVDDTVYDHLTPFRTAVQPWTKGIKGFPYEAADLRMRHYSDILSEELGGAGQMEKGESTELMRRRRFQLALQDYSIDVTLEQAEIVQQAYLKCQFTIQCFDGIETLITQLQQQGIIVGLLTNGAEQHQWRKIRALELDKLIAKHNIFVSGSYGIDKPDPRIFTLINEHTGTTPEECIYIGDSWRNDIVGAHRAGWSMIWFNHRLQQRQDELELLGEASSVEDLRAYLL